MKSTYMFRDQVNTVTNWFGAWNECEQTVALYSLLRKILPAQARFLQQVLEQSVSSSTDVQILESQANSPAYISSLCKESKEQAVTRLLKCLPLLKPHNEDAKVEYLKIIPKILAHSIENGCHIEESRQLLSYSLIHPAINSEERSQFNLWLGHLEDRFMLGSYQQQQQQQQQQSGLDPHCLYMDKTSQHNGGITQNFMHGLNGWQLATSRDSGIALSEMDSASSGLQSFTVSGSNVCSAPGGRPITSTAAVNGGSVGDVTTTVNSLSNGSPGLLQPKEHLPLQATLSGPAAFNSVPSSQGGIPVASIKNHRALSRSSSIVPPKCDAPSSNVSDWLNKHHNEMVKSSRQPTTLLTQEHPHAPLSPQSSISSSGSGSDCHQDEGQHQQQLGQGQARNTFLEDKSGMRDVPIWLKSLRLHKYALLFQQLRYDEMLSLNETWLTSQGVTKGARNKIIISIKKLRERQNVLRTMEKDIMECGNLKPALSEIKGILNTPIKAYSRLEATKSLDKQSDDSDSSGKGSSGSKEGHVRREVGSSNEGDSSCIAEGDLPGQMTRVLGKLCTQLLVTNRLDDDCFVVYMNLLDKCMMHEAFTADQKKKLSSWKQQIQKIWQPAHRKYCLEQRKSFGAVYPNLLRGQRALRGQQLLQQPGQPKWTFNSHSAVTVGGAPVAPNSANMPMYQNALNATYAAQPAMFEMPKQGVARTHSAPIKSNQYGFSLTPKPVQDMSVTEPELTARLDSLCLSMTEHALGGLGETDACNIDRGATF